MCSVEVYMERLTGTGWRGGHGSVAFVRCRCQGLCLFSVLLVVLRDCFESRLGLPVSDVMIHDTPGG